MRGAHASELQSRGEVAQARLGYRPGAAKPSDVAPDRGGRPDALKRAWAVPRREFVAGLEHDAGETSRAYAKAHASTIITGEFTDTQLLLGDAPEALREHINAKYAFKVSGKAESMRVHSAMWGGLSVKKLIQHDPNRCFDLFYVSKPGEASAVPGGVCGGQCGDGGDLTPHGGVQIMSAG